jgi:hypothetical protein
MKLKELSKDELAYLVFQVIKGSNEAYEAYNEKYR